MAARLISNAVSYGTLLACGDLSQRVITWKLKQAKEGKPLDMNLPSAARCWLAGTGFFGPWFYYWYRFLDGKVPGAATMAVVKKTSIDMFLFSPFSLSAFFIVFSFLDGNSREVVIQDWKRRFPKTYLFALSFWIPAQAVNFRFMPPTFRVYYLGVVSFFWANIICYVKSSM